jgi:hypothetical protein
LPGSARRAERTVASPTRGAQTTRTSRFPTVPSGASRPRTGYR